MVGENPESCCLNCLTMWVFSMYPCRSRSGIYCLSPSCGYDAAASALGCCLLRYDHLPRIRQWGRTTIKCMMSVWIVNVNFWHHGPNLTPSAKWCQARRRCLQSSFRPLQMTFSHPVSTLFQKQSNCTQWDCWLKWGVAQYFTDKLREILKIVVSMCPGTQHMYTLLVSPSEVLVPHHLSTVIIHILIVKGMWDVRCE